MTPRCLAAAALAALAAFAAADAAHYSLDEDAAMHAIVGIRRALPEEWRVTDVRWSTAPFGWEGDSSCVLVRVEDGTVRFPHPTLDDCTYAPFYKVWILPFGWEGRMRVVPIDATAPSAFYLGENGEVRILYRSLGRNSWPEAPERLCEELGLAAVETA